MDVPDVQSGALPDNRQLARVLRQIGDILEFKDENSFKIRSYRMAAETIEGMADSIAEVAQRGGAAELQKIPGIGKTISAQIVEIIQAGKSSYLETLTEDTPISVLELLQVSGIGMKTAQMLYRDFGIQGLDGLKRFAEAGGLVSVPGLGEKSSQRIMRSIERLEGQRRASDQGTGVPGG